MSYRSQLLILLGLLTWRCINAYYVRTFFQPDEYFQSLEPAWQLAFGSNSGAWITWEWREQLRSSLHPFLFATVYKLTDRICRLLSASEHARMGALLAAPKLLQALFAAVMDFCTWRLASKIYGRHSTASLAALALTVSSPWQWYCSTRTFSNSLETTLTAVALDLFPWTWLLTAEPHATHKAAPLRLNWSLCAAATACVLRPTNIIIWITISICLLSHSNSARTIGALLPRAILCGTATLAISVAVDRWFYEQWALPPLRFLYFNIVQSLAVFYGSNRVDYYLTEGIPLLMLAALPFAIIGMWRSCSEVSTPLFSARVRYIFAMAILATIAVLTLVSHKEVRFIYPLLPMMHILAAGPLSQFSEPFPFPTNRINAILLLAGVLLHVYIASYVSLVHQRGVVDVIHYLRHEQQVRSTSLSNGSIPSAKGNVTAGFLMPCHSTPWRSHLVYPEIEAWALTCEPPLMLTPEQRASYLDEADVFYADPTTWIAENMVETTAISDDETSSTHYWTTQINTTKRHWPQYLVFFQQLQPILVDALQGTAYRECRRFFNSHWHDDGRRHGDVVVWCLER